jgi:hypothetical protein
MISNVEDKNFQRWKFSFLALKIFVSSAEDFRPLAVRRFPDRAPTFL